MAMVLEWTSRHRWSVATLVLLAVLFLAVGVPLDLLALVVFASLVLAIDALATRGLGGFVRVARDWAPVIAVLLVYSLSSSVADTLGRPVHARELVDAERWLFGGEVPTVWLQERYLRPRTQWWEVLLTLTYVSHFFATLVVGVWLYQRQRHRWHRFLVRFCVLNAAAIATFALYPAAPPWWASERGLVGPASRTLSRGWSVLGLESAGAMVTFGQDRANEVAAMPSLHTGWAVLLCLFLWGAARRSRPLLLLYPPLMGATLVFGGEHYVIDVLAGGAYAIGTHLGVSAHERRCEHAASATA